MFDESEYVLGHGRVKSVTVSENVKSLREYDVLGYFVLLVNA